MPTKKIDRRDVGDGMVHVVWLEHGWYHVQIGRAKGPKRFNLRDSEARQLVEQLQKLLPE